MLRVAAGRDGTGILLLDSARINRYDIGVPVFGLLALLAFNRAERDRSDAWYALTGLLTGLASLTHLYGVFWLPIFAGLSIARRGRDRRRQRTLTLLLGGFALPWAPWAIYIATGWSDYLGQARMVAARFDLFNPRFYIDNVLHGDGPLSFDWAVRSLREAPPIRVGTWTMVLGVPAACAALIWAAYRHGRSVWSTLAVAALLQMLMFVALLKVKTIHYMIALWPLGALLLAWLGVFLWDRGRLALRISLLALLGLIVGEGVTRIADAWRTARQTTPYDWYEAEVASCIPPGSGAGPPALLARPSPVSLSHVAAPDRSRAPGQYSEEPISFDQALEQVNPAVILVDRHIDELMTKAAAPDDPNHRLYVGFEAFKARRRATLTLRDQGPHLRHDADLFQSHRLRNSESAARRMRRRLAHLRWTCDRCCRCHWISTHRTVVGVEGTWVLQDMEDAEYAKRLSAHIGGARHIQRSHSCGVAACEEAAQRLDVFAKSVSMRRRRAFGCRRPLGWQMAHRRGHGSRGVRHKPYSFRSAVLARQGIEPDLGCTLTQIDNVSKGVRERLGVRFGLPSPGLKAAHDRSPT